MEPLSREHQLEMVSVRLVKDRPMLSDQKIQSPKDAVCVMGAMLCEMDREVLVVINLESDGKPINGHIASIGALNQALAEPRELLKTAILSNAASMIIMHCHPSGSLEPSREDVEITDRMIHLCRLVGIPLLDHIIVGGDNQEYFSFRERRILRYQDLRLETDYRCLNFNAENSRNVAECGIRRRKCL